MMLMLGRYHTNCGFNEFDPMTKGPDCCLNTSTTCIFLQHGPQSTSVKNMIHMSQCKKSFSETTAQSPVAALTFLFLKCSGQESWGQKVRLWKREGEHEALQSARAPAVQPLVHSTPCPLVPHPWWPRFSRWCPRHQAPPADAGQGARQWWHRGAVHAWLRSWRLRDGLQCSTAHIQAHSGILQASLTLRTYTAGHFIISCSM